ncbi:MAG: PHP domain-containing protein [Chloroflexota bacterium]|nr:PHP domain-containing protein [Dehalococcoidia bacterium]MDW8045829.1 PHP domain-containing protein [Chloroflexota bacterium]
MALADFHLHSTASDGVHRPAEVVAAAARNGVRVLALTDHDTLDGLGEAAAAARSWGVRLVPGIELSTELGSRDVHLLALGIDVDRSDLHAFLAEQREHRVGRARRIVEVLRQHGIELDERRLFEIAGEASVGRPHVARAMLERGYVSSVQEAFDRWLGDGKPGDIPRPRLSPAEAIARIHDWGGIAVAAHPCFLGDGWESVLAELAAAGVDAMEVYYRDYPAEVVADLEVMADQLGLIRSGGSDFHGLRNPGERAPGDILFPDGWARRFVEFVEGRCRRPYLV